MKLHKANGIAVLVSALAVLPCAAHAWENPIDGEKPSIQQRGEVTPAALAFVISSVNYARSSAGDTETIVSLRNRGGASCSVEVEWMLGFGGTVSGISGPLTLNPGDTGEFATANSGESVSPFVINAFRNTTTDFEGSARISSTCSTALGVNAIMATGLGSSSGPKYVNLSVN
jgi:hypothetical protein